METIFFTIIKKRHTMKFITLFLFMVCVQTVSVMGQSTQFFSPLNAIAVGPNGLPTNKATVKPYCCPSTAIEITSGVNIADNDLQWINIPLNGLAEGNISGVTVCYQIVGKGAGAISYISQVRLDEMSLPNSAMVKMDDPTDLKSTTPTCYTAKANNYYVKGTTTLSLRIALAAGDRILVGGITVHR
jgi:hypothetical protein